jgi:predicted permease
MTTFFKDLQYGTRQLIKSPVFTIVAVLSLALGIGANITIFSMLNAVKLRSLPVHKPHELHVFKWEGEGTKASVDNNFIFRSPNGNWTADLFSYQNYCLFRDNVTDATEIMATGHLGGSIHVNGQRCQSMGMIVSGNFFDGLGLNALLGRTLRPDDNRPGADLVAVVSHAFWKQHLGLDPKVLGQSVTVKERVFTVVGVLSQNFLGPQIGRTVDVYVPISAVQPKVGSVGIMARIEARHEQKVQKQCEMLFQRAIYPSAALDAKKSKSLSNLFRRAIRHAAPKESEKSLSILFEEGGRGRERYTVYKFKPLRVLIPIMAAVLLIVCVNLAGLLLARGAVRQHELSIRGALGAGRWRLIRLLLAETVLLSCLGAGMGLLIGSWSKAAIAKMVWIHTSGFDLRNDGLVLGFTLALSVTTLLIFGILPAFRSTRLNPVDGLREKGTTRRLPLRLGRTLVIAQVGLAFLLLTGAGLFVRTSLRLSHADKGFDTENLLTFVINPGSADYQGERVENFHDQAAAAIVSLPGVQALTRSERFLIVDGSGSSGGICYRHVGNAFFSTMGIPLLKGRDFKASYDESESKAVIINELLARQLFPGKDPIGMPMPFRPGFQVIGVCQNFKCCAIKEEMEPHAFFHYRRNKNTARLCYAVRTTVSPKTLIPAMRKAVAGIDSTIALDYMLSQDDRIDSSFKRERNLAHIACGAALMAVFLLYLGLYGLQAFLVTHRTREIGVRVALGASRKQVLAPILRSSFFLGVLGVLLGLPVALATMGVIRSYIWGVTLHDPATLAGSAMMILLVSVVAAYFPARRAACIDPMEALRYE